MIYFVSQELYSGPGRKEFYPPSDRGLYSFQGNLGNDLYGFGGGGSSVDGGTVVLPAGPALHRSVLNKFGDEFTGPETVDYAAVKPRS